MQQQAHARQEQGRPHLSVTIEETNQSHAPQKMATPFDPEYWSLESQRSKAAKEYVKKVRLEQKAHRQKMKVLEQARRVAELKEYELKEEARRAVEAQHREQRKRQLQQSIDKLRKDKEERGEQFKRFKRFLKDFGANEPLHVKLQKQFRANLSQMQEQKRQPCTPPKIQQFLRSHKSSSRYSTIEPVQLRVYKSKYYEKVAQERTHLNQHEHQQLVQRRKAYSQAVKEQFKPAVVHNSVEPSPRAEDQPQEDSYEYHKRVQHLGQQYLQFMRRLVKKQRKSERTQQRHESEYVAPSKLVIRGRPPQLSKLTRKGNPLYNIDSLMQSEKTAVLEGVSLKMDAAVRRAEEDLRHGVVKGGRKELERAKEQIDDKYLTSIRAKLKLLQIE